VPAAEQAILIAAAFASSSVTAMVGLGGGILLIAIMPLFLPPLAVVPVHGVVQLASNGSRAWFARREIDWTLLPSFVAGLLLGTVAGSQLVKTIPVELLPVPLALFILVMTWAPQLGRSGTRLPGAFFTLGLLQSFLTLFVGATGPLNLPFLLRHGLSPGQVIASHALLMSLVHGIKIVAFGVLGFAFAPYLPVTVGMLCAVTAGSWAGTRLRMKLPERWLRPVLKGLVSLLALRMLYQALFL